MPSILYKTTNLINNKYYIGVHEQENPYEFDGYLGSGVVIKDAIKKHGKENFNRQTLVIGEKDYTYNLEQKYVADKWKLTECYNLWEGGHGSVGTLPKSDKTKKKMSESATGKIMSEEARLKMSIAKTGRTLSKEQVLKMSKTYEITFPDGHKEIITNMRKFCRENNLNNSAMIQISLGKLNHHKQFKAEKL